MHKRAINILSFSQFWIQVFKLGQLQSQPGQHTLGEHVHEVPIHVRERGDERQEGRRKPRAKQRPIHQRSVISCEGPFAGDFCQQ